MIVMSFAEENLQYELGASAFKNPGNHHWSWWKSFLGTTAMRRNDIQKGNGYYDHMSEVVLKLK